MYHRLVSRVQKLLPNKENSHHWLMYMYFSVVLVCEYHERTPLLGNHARVCVCVCPCPTDMFPVRQWRVFPHRILLWTWGQEENLWRQTWNPKSGMKHTNKQKVQKALIYTYRYSYKHNLPFDRTNMYTCIMYILTIAHSIKYFHISAGLYYVHVDLGHH